MMEQSLRGAARMALPRCTLTSCFGDDCCKLPSYCCPFSLCGCVNNRFHPDTRASSVQGNFFATWGGAGRETAYLVGGNLHSNNASAASDDSCLLSRRNRGL